MKMYTLQTVQQLPISLSEAWEFFSTPFNLTLITPPSMNFRITCDVPDRVYAGTIITYRVNVLPAITATWVTEISYVDAPHYFVDEQRFGPYAFWHHKHFFREIAGGVEMEDTVHYGLPFGPLGRLVHPWLVKPRLDAIFRFRKEALLKRFGEYHKDAARHSHGVPVA